MSVCKPESAPLGRIKSGTIEIVLKMTITVCIPALDATTSRSRLAVPFGDMICKSLASARVSVSRSVCGDLGTYIVMQSLTRISRVQGAPTSFTVDCYHQHDIACAARIAILPYMSNSLRRRQVVMDMMVQNRPEEKPRFRTANVIIRNPALVCWLSPNHIIDRLLTI
jgi:hypothetical protein